MGMAAVSIDVLLPAFPEIRDDFGLAEQSTQVGSLITAFFLGLACGQLVYGPLSDRFGRKPLLLSGLALFLVGALGSVAAPTLTGVIACRFLWGFGAAAPRSLALAMVRDRYEGERMARTMSNVMATFIIVPILAPTVGAGALALSASWRVVLWIPIVVALLLAVWSTRMPETLPPDARRSVSPGALWEALRVVARSRQTVAFAFAATCMFGMMSAYIAGAQTIIEEVFGLGDLFPYVFGLIAITLGLGSLASGHLVGRLGLHRLIRVAAVYVVVSAAALNACVFAFGGDPPFWLFAVALSAMLPGVSLLVPNCNTAAMAPVPHVAGMAAAILGTVSTGGGALLGAVVDRAFDGTVRPFAVGALVYSATAAALVLLVARPKGRGPEAIPAHVKVAVESTSPLGAIDSLERPGTAAPSR
jgi:DHA1 family bicyclomycin/chloramphenicol resistance-like MFS transporter